MKNIFLLFQIKLRMLVNGIRFAKGSKWIKVISLSILGLLFLGGFYALFYRILIYLQGVPLLGPILIVRLISMIFLVFFAMLIFSNIITAFSSIYFSSDLNFLLSAPLSFRAIFVFKFFETMFYSNWMVLFFLLPVLSAYGRINNALFTFYFWIVIVLFPFFVICTSIGILFSLLLMRGFPTKKTRDIFLVLGVILGAGVYLVVRFLQPEKLVNPDVMMGVLQYLVTVKTPATKVTPSFWITESIVSMVKYDLGKSFLYFGLMTGFALMFFLITILIAQKIYYPGWAGAQEGSKKKKIKNQKSKIKIKNGKFTVITYGPIRALLAKDIKTFFRETSQWSQILLLVALIVVYLYNIYKLPLTNFYLKSIVSFLNIGMTGFVLASVSLRFVFPAVSLEKVNFWIIRSSPLSMNKFLWEKFWISLIPLLILAGSLIVFSNLILKVDKFFMILSCGTVFLITIGLTGLGIGMGAIFPRFNVENIAQIESSMGGMFYMVFALFYVAMILVLEALPVKMYFLYKLRNIPFFNVKIIIILGIIFLVLNAGVLLIPMIVGIKNLKNLEI